MKRFLIIAFALLMANLPSFAVITPEEAASQSYIENHGNSSEVSRLIILQQNQIGGNTAVSYQKPKEIWQNVRYPKWFTEKRINAVRKGFEYFDCGLDDGKFGNSNIVPQVSPSDL